MPCEDEGRDQGDTSTSQEVMCYVVSKPPTPKLGEWLGQTLPPSLRSNQTCPHLDLGLPASGTQRRNLCYLKHLTYGTLFQPPLGSNTDEIGKEKI